MDFLQRRRDEGREDVSDWGVGVWAVDVAHGKPPGEAPSSAFIERMASDFHVSRSTLYEKHLEIREREGLDAYPALAQLIEWAAARWRRKGNHTQAMAYLIRHGRTPAAARKWLSRNPGRSYLEAGPPQRRAADFAAKPKDPG